MIDQTAAIYLCRLCRRLEVLPTLADALQQIAENPEAPRPDLAALPYETRTCRLFFTIIDLDQKAKNSLAVAYCLDQINAVAVQYVLGDGVYDMQTEAAQERQSQQSDFYAAVGGHLKLA
jgi:hypothetical protein